MSGGAERAARRIAEQMNDRGRTYDNSPSVDEIAAIIREETGTQWDKSAFAQKALHNLWDAGYFNCPGEKLGHATDLVLAALPTAPDEGGKR